MADACHFISSILEWSHLNQYKYYYCDRDWYCILLCRRVTQATGAALYVVQRDVWTIISMIT